MQKAAIAEHRNTARAWQPYALSIPGRDGQCLGGLQSSVRPKQQQAAPVLIQSEVDAATVFLPVTVASGFQPSASSDLWRRGRILICRVLIPTERFFGYYGVATGGFLVTAIRHWIGPSKQVACSSAKSKLMQCNKPLFRSLVDFATRKVPTGFMEAREYNGGTESSRALPVQRLAAEQCDDDETRPILVPLPLWTTMARGGKDNGEPQ